MQTSSHKWDWVFLVWCGFFKGLKAGVFHSVLIFFKSSSKESVFSLVNQNFTLENIPVYEDRLLH